LAQRQMIISPQFGQLVFIASSPGGIVRLHDMHFGITMFIFSLTATPQGKLDNTTASYICYLLKVPRHTKKTAKAATIQGVEEET